MSQQGDAFVRAVLRTDPRPMSHGENVAYLRQRGGSGRGAARLAGVSESTLRRWAAGTVPRPASMQRIASTVRELRTPPGQRHRTDEGVAFMIVSHERKRFDRTRMIKGTQLKLRGGTLAASWAAWVATGDGDHALKVFVSGIGNPWYRVNLGRGAGQPPDDDDDLQEAALDEGYEISIA